MVGAEFGVRRLRENPKSHIELRTKNSKRIIGSFEGFFDLGIWSLFTNWGLGI
jgi:hypothetical protein